MFKVGVGWEVSMCSFRVRKVGGIEGLDVGVLGI